MAKKQVDEQIKEVKTNLLAGKVMIGTDKVLKGLRAGSMTRVYVASNCPTHIKEDVERYATLQNVLVVNLSQNNEELGVLCKKNFFISVLGIIA